MSKMYSERIKQLERSLEESRNKEKNYLRVIEEQSQEIHTLRTEISMTSRSRVTSNELEYLNMENQTLKNKLGKMANDRTQRLSSSNNLGVSIVNSMVEKPMSMTHRPEALPSAPRISRNY
jgi:septal ring factor EnvC (AmiA/AmiB activator)